MGRHLSPRYSQVILVSGYLVLTAVNWSQHWCPICVSVFLCSDPKLAKKYEIDHWSRSSKIINWSADSFQINHVTSMTWHISLRYGHRILVSGYPVLTAENWPYCECFVNVQCKRYGLAKTRLRHPSLPFDSLPYTTGTFRRRVRMYARTLGQSRDNQTKRGWPYSMSMGLYPTCALRAWEPRYKRHSNGLWKN